MKKALIPITAALLTFSILSNSVSAPFVQYYVARFSGSASGWCWIFTEFPMNESVMPSAYGKGRFDIRGLAIVRKGTDPDFGDYYWANSTDPNTHIWMYRTQMRVTWGSNACAVHFWTTDTTVGVFNDTGDYFMIGFFMPMGTTSFAGWYKEETAPIQFIRGNAVVYVLPYDPSGEVFVVMVVLAIDTTHFLTFIWISEDIEGYPPGHVARSFSHRVTVWPIEWHPIPG